MGYKEAKINKNTLFKNIEENGKDTDNSSSETLESQYDLDIKLTKYEVKANKCILGLKDIFIKSQEIFEPLDNTNNINSYIKDLNIPKSINNSNFKFNNNYRTDLFDIICSHKNCLTSYFYNEKSGLTLSLLHALKKSRKLKKDFRYLYLNSEYIKRYKKKYFIFRMAKLFQKDEEEAFVALFKSKDEEKANFNAEYIIDCLNMVLKYFKNIYIIFDNIKSPETYEIVKNLISKINPFENSNILLFFRINTYTISLIENIKSFSNKLISLLPNDNSSNQELPPEAYFDSKIKGWTDEDKEQYKKEIKNIINNINNFNTIDYFIFLIKLLYNELFSKNNSLTISDFNNYLEKFLPLLYISICKENFKTSINKIQFRTNFIKEIIEYQFNFLLKNLLTDKIFKEIKTKSTEGIYIEKEIIFYLITKLIKLDKITIEKVYCFDSKIEQRFTNTGIIFIQKLESAPIYDFGIVNYFNGELVFKGYQIGINKPYESLIYLNKEKIRIDVLYFISKINAALNINITKFTFGIITTINAYKSQINKNIKIDNEFEDDIGMENHDIYDDNKENKKEQNEKDNEYKNYNKMKNYCNRNNFEFILFDPKDNLFYIDNENK